MPGRGWSSPVIWNRVVYLTSAISGKPFKQPSPGLYGNDYIAASSPVVHAGRVFLLQDSEQESFLTALDAKTGAELWRAPRSSKGLLHSSPTPSAWARPATSR